MEAEIHYLVVFTISLVLTLIITFSIIKQPKESLISKILYIGAIISINGWVFALLKLQDPSNDLESFGKLAFIGPILLSLFIYLFSYTFPQRRKLKLIHIFIFIITLLTIIFTIFNLIFTNVRIEEGELIRDQAPLYLFFVFNLVLNILLTLYELYKSFLSSNQLNKNRIRLIAYGIGVSFVIAVITNILIPGIIGTSISSNLGPYSLIPFLVLTTLAIIRYRFLDIRVLLGRLFYYVTLGSLPYGVFYLLHIIYNEFFGSPYDSRALTIGVFVAFLFIIAFENFNKFIKKQVTTRFINPGYDPYEVVDSLGRDLATTLELNEVAKITIDILKRTIRAKFEKILVIKEKTEDQDKQVLHFDGEDSVNEYEFNNYQNAINHWSATEQKPILLDELQFMSESTVSDPGEVIKEIGEEMDQKRIKAIFPIATQEKIMGMILLGEKEADSPYTDLDQELLTSIASTVGLAIARSLYYEEIKAFSESLQRKVDEATIHLKEQNKDLEVALSRLQKIRQQEQDMIDVMGHELRTPITLVRNALAVLDMDFKPDKQIPPDKLGSYIDKALEAARREMVLIETLLAATKIDANRVQLRLEKINIIDVINTSIDALAPAAQDKKLDLRFNNPEQIKEIPVFADRVRTQEIADNFINNAIKYTIEGYVEISFEELEQEGKPMIKVNVKDTGIGISKEDIAKLGRKFFRAKQFIKESQSGEKVQVTGTGLGLYVSFELVRIMGGKIDVQSEVGKGSTFSFTLPKHTGQEDKQIDQTFSAEEEIEDRMRKRLAKERKELLGNGNGEKKEKIEKKQDKEAVAKAEEEGFRRISSANEIISKINKGKKYLEGEGKRVAGQESQVEGKRSNEQDKKEEENKPEDNQEKNNKEEDNTKEPKEEQNDPQPNTQQEEKQDTRQEGN